MASVYAHFLSSCLLYMYIYIMYVFSCLLWRTTMAALWLQNSRRRRSFSHLVSSVGSGSSQHKHETLFLRGGRREEQTGMWLEKEKGSGDMTHTP